METRSRKRKQLTSPPNPYARIYSGKRIHTNRSSVKDLRARRVFSPSSLSDVKEESEVNVKEVSINERFYKEGQKEHGETEIDTNLEEVDLGVSQENGGISEKEADPNLGFAEKDQKNTERSELEIGVGIEIEIEISNSCEEAQLIQTTPQDGKVCDESNPEIGIHEESVNDFGVSEKNEKNGESSELEFELEDQLIETTSQNGKIVDDPKLNSFKGANLCIKDGSFREAKIDEQAKPKAKMGSLVPCSRAKLYKNPSSFSYRRLLPYLTDIENDITKELRPCQKVDNSAEGKPPTSLTPSQDILINGINREVLTHANASGDSNASNIPSSAVECSNTGSSKDTLVKSTTVKTLEPSILPAVDNFMIKELPYLSVKSAPQTPNIVSDRTIKSQNASSFVPDINPLDKSLSSLVTLESSSSKNSGKVEKENPKNAGNTVTESCDGEWIQSTPPDSDVFCKPGPGATKAGALESPWNVQSSSKAKLGVLVPSSRMKLYKTPSSFSYRRLLPYLMDLAKSNTNAIGSQPCGKVDKTVKEGSPSSFLPSQDVFEAASNQIRINGQSPGASDVPLDGNSAAPTGPSNIDSSYLQTSEEPSVEISNKNPVAEFVIEEPQKTSIVSEGNDSVIMKPPHMSESESQVLQDTQAKFSKVELAHDATCIVQEKNLSVVVPEPSSPSEGTTRDLVIFPEVVDDCSVVQKTCTGEKSLGELSNIEEPGNIEPVTPSEKSILGSSTGILKRYPRGCRGICSCLNCASFRLHAERAFEFSRNQMQDTEEVACFLIKELSALRTLIEKSTASAESHAVVQVPKAKEACLNAVRAEGLVKDHLKQMNQELNIHCRTHCAERPRVRFAGELFQAKLDE